MKYLLLFYVCAGYGGDGSSNCGWKEALYFETEADCLRVLYPSDNFKFPTIRIGEGYLVARCVEKRGKK